ncbi:hypothetical protein K525DRAFT_284823 [Schizophyllum commune Loenen D]|nr:hypothetical protein K525DRAFT_284823 [Schizophyllum commune Loenen D]
MTVRKPFSSSKWPRAISSTIGRESGSAAPCPQRRCSTRMRCNSGFRASRTSNSLRPAERCRCVVTMSTALSVFIILFRSVSVNSAQQ